MPFPYYRRLNRRQQAIYRASDRIAEVPLPEPAVARRLADEVRRALLSDDRGATERSCQALVREVCRQLGTEPVSVRVLSVRPSNAEAELHGLYVREEGERAVISVWMRTAARRRVVSYRTFLRTLLHELGHHLDYCLFHLEDSFHTEGFFRRESSLVRQLAPKPKPKAKRSGAPAQASSGPPADKRAETAADVPVRKQLDLPI